MGPEEKEFNPAEYPPEYLTVGLTEAMPSILDRIEDAWVRTPNAVLVIPRGSHAFHSTHDFLALGKLQDTREVRISIASPDPIITGLARLLGFHVVDPPPGHPVLADDPAADMRDRDDDGNIEKPTAPLPLGIPLDQQAATSAQLAANERAEQNLGAHNADRAPGWIMVPTGPSAGSTTSTWLNSATDYLDGQRVSNVNGYVAPIHKPGIPQPRTKPRQTGSLAPHYIGGGTPSGAAGRADDLQGVVGPLSPPVTTNSGRLKARRVLTEGKAYSDGKRVRYGGRVGPARWGRVVPIALIVLVALLLGSSAYAYVYLPHGSVSVTPLSQAITDLNVQVSVLTLPDAKVPPQEPRDTLANPTINASRLGVPLTEEATVGATGSRQVARGRAQGMITFTNRTGGVITVPSGTQFKASNGVVVQTTQTVNVPATIFGATFGTMNVGIVALVEGPDGNIGSGQIAGIYGGTLNYVNSALQGGTLETIKVVKQEDIDGAVAQLRAKMDGETAGAVMGLLGAGQTIITQTISLQNAAYDANHKAGEDGNDVHVKLTAEAQAYTFKDAEMQSAVVGAVRDYVKTSYPDDVSPTLSENVDYAPPVVDTAADGKITYKTTANARVAFALTPHLAQEIQNLVKGQSVTQARTLIMSQTFSSYLRPDDIRAKLLWFSIGTMPNDPARIEVQPSVGTGVGSSAPPTDSPTPSP